MEKTGEKDYHYISKSNIPQIKLTKDFINTGKKIKILS